MVQSVLSHTIFISCTDVTTRRRTLGYQRGQIIKDDIQDEPNLFQASYYTV